MRMPAILVVAALPTIAAGQASRPAREWPAGVPERLASIDAIAQEFRGWQPDDGPRATWFGDDATVHDTAMLLLASLASGSQITSGEHRIAVHRFAIWLKNKQDPVTGRIGKGTSLEDHAFATWTLTLAYSLSAYNPLRRNVENAMKCLISHALSPDVDMSAATAAWVALVIHASRRLRIVLPVDATIGRWLTEHKGPTTRPDDDVYPATRLLCRTLGDADAAPAPADVELALAACARTLRVAQDPRRVDLTPALLSALALRSVQRDGSPARAEEVAWQRGVLALARVDGAASRPSSPALDLAAGTRAAAMATLLMLAHEASTPLLGN